MEASSEESADSGCEADNLPAEDQAEGTPFEFARYDSNDFDEVSQLFLLLRRLLCFEDYKTRLEGRIGFGFNICSSGFLR